MSGRQTAGGRQTAAPAALKLIVGLGNPGRKYAATRHNVGFGVVDALAQRFGQGNPRARFHGQTQDILIRGCRGLLLCPHTYMNRSGLSVLEARDFFKIPDAEIIIVCDDFNLPLGKLRCRPRGSAGGQKGLQDIFRRLGTEQLPRLRVGIGLPPERWDVTDFVLSRFTEDELPTMQQAIGRAADAAADWVEQGIATCMNRYNANAAASD